MKKIIVSIDWGGTFIKLGIFDAVCRKLLYFKRYSSEKLTKPERFFPALEGLLQKSFRERKLSYRNIEGTAIGAPGIIDMKDSFIYYLPNIAGWENFPFKYEFERKFPFPLLVLDNDANLAAWGEFKEGTLRDSNNAALVTLGTGIGCGLIIGRRLFHSRTSAAEAGHMAISLQRKKCSCSAYGCVEAFLGEAFFLDSLEKRFWRQYKIHTLKDLFILAKRGNQQALVYWARYGKILGVFLANLINLLNPDHIALGGGISGAFTFFRAALERELQRQTMKPQLSQVVVTKASLGNRAGVWGGFWLAKEKLKK